MIIGGALFSLTGDWPQRPDWVAIAPRIGLAILSLTVLLFVLLLGEEVGWRGFAQPHMLTRYSPLVTTLVIGIVWGVWHIPGLLLRTNPLAPHEIIIFILETTLMSLAYTWLYKETQGSLVVVNLLHTFYDAIGYSFLRVVPMETGSLLLLAAHVLVCGAALLLGGVKWFWQSPEPLL